MKASESIELTEKECAERGATFLDWMRPGWYNEISLEELNINSSGDCVIGQLYDYYSDGLEEVGLVQSVQQETAVEYFGFDTPVGLNANDLTEAWTDEIRVRRMRGITNIDFQQDFGCVADSVVRGGELMDKLYPNWLDNINVETLDLFDPHNCVLGQCCGDEYANTCTTIFGHRYQRNIPAFYGLNAPDTNMRVKFDLPDDYRDCCRVQTEAWKVYIKMRRQTS